MEIGLDHRIPTYSGGLGVLAGDTMKSCADLKVPVVGVTLLYHKGYFDQLLNDDGLQNEAPVQWNPADVLYRLDARVTVQIEGRTVTVGAWQFTIHGVEGKTVPIIFLDTDLPENSDWDRTITHTLYGEGQRMRLAQEIVLGIGGVRMLEALGYTGIQKYHMNEGHSSLLVLELLRRSREAGNGAGRLELIKSRCIFTTHTPVPAGHDKFHYDLVERMLGGFLPMDVVRSLGGEGQLNMTLLALNLSGYINGVARLHGKVSRRMFPGYQIDSITNGAHARTWTAPAMQALFDRFIPDWRHDPFSLRHALRIPMTAIWNAHLQAKRELIALIERTTGERFEEGVFTIGFARRAAEYKRADLIFTDLERLLAIERRAGRLQLVFAGKAHPRDNEGKAIIQRIVQKARRLTGTIRIVYLPNYSMAYSRTLIAGVDLWLNNPAVPHEASGTSGMKAALNAVPHFSTLDGWWTEGHIEGVTGWAIGRGSDGGAPQTLKEELDSLYSKLENTILPLFYNRWEKWVDVMRNAVAINGSYFNTHRMVSEYVIDSYM
ncbi:MAG: alpha-glucan family phosphorylase [Candidatus Sumerlaeia bacterium]